ncbi:unnamed protein product [Effrenium voratum]|nr:unnamed protein product [Effrenium voratum]
MNASFREVFEQFQGEHGFEPCALPQAMRLLGMNPTDQQASELQRKFGGCIGYEEFCKEMEELLARWLARDQAQQLLQDFQVFDPDRTGRISVQKLVDIMRMSGNGFSEAELEEMLLNAGVDGTTVEYKDVVFKHFFGAGSGCVVGDWESLKAAQPMDALQEAATLNSVAKLKAERGRKPWTCTVKLWPEWKATQLTTPRLLQRFTEAMGHADALELYLRALGIREKVLGPKHFYVATTLDCIANLMDRSGQIEEALRFACRSLEIWERFFGSEHSHIGKILYNLAGRREQLADLHGALDFYVRALGIFTRSQGESEEVADTLDGIAELMIRLGQTREAVDFYRRELFIRERLLGSAHPEVLQLRAVMASLEAS